MPAELVDHVARRRMVDAGNAVVHQAKEIKDGSDAYVKVKKLSNNSIKIFKLFHKTNI